ncbi:MAG TPA: tetratricopeptide repeat protein [Gemmatimonadota bacterium]|nr:tetratricopeptide repeat protein [Gemmatimonadota bacterium]
MAFEFDHVLCSGDFSNVLPLSTRWVTRHVRLEDAEALLPYSLSCLAVTEGLPDIFPDCAPTGVFVCWYRPFATEGRTYTANPHRTIELRTLGHVSVHRMDGGEVHEVVHQPKRLAFLVYLALAEPRGFHRRDSLLPIFWPELPEKRARNALNKTLHFLRSHLGDDVVESRGSTEVGLDPGRIWTDVAAFEDALAEGRAGEAIELYAGPFLQGFHVSEAVELEHWIDRQREHLEVRFATALQDLAIRTAARGDPAVAMDLWRKLVEHDPTNSRAVVGLMELLESVGERGAALEQAARHATLLREEFDAEPDAEVEACADRLRAATRPPPLHGSAPDNLPWQPTSLVGREREQAALCRMIGDPSARLITLTGPGGTGKTRLAIDAAEQVIPRFPDGVFFVNLGTLQDAALVGVTIARTMGITIEAGAGVLESLRSGIEQRRCLLLLDGFETVLPAADLIAELLEGTDSLEVLVTSRAVLRLRGERVFPVPPLSVPERESALGIKELLDFGAIDLFVQRAQAADPEFQLTIENRHAVAGICAGLDGLPLAIELAAARVRVLEPSMILARLGQRFDLLQGGPRDLPERQQTLRRTFDWSYDLLPGPQQQLFRYLCVFVGGSTLEGVGEVCYGASDQEAAVLEDLAALVDNSLLRRVPTPDQPRFEMLDTIREYGMGLLADAGELPELQDRHAHYFLKLAERAEPGLASKSQAEWVDRLEPEFANVQAVLDWALEWGEIELAVRLGSALWWFMWLRGHFTEMRWRLDQALARRSLLPLALQANLLVARGAIASVDGEHELAMTLYQEALGLERDSLNVRQVTQLLRSTAFALSRRGQYEPATELLEESLLLARAMESPTDVTAALRGLAKMGMHVRDYRSAKELYDEALDLGRTQGDRNAEAWALYGLSEVARHEGDFDKAAALLEDGLEICRKIDSKPGIAYLRLASAHVARYQGDLVEARRRYVDALRLLQDLGNRRRMAICLFGLAALDVREKAFERALVLMGAVDPMSEAGGIQLAPADEAEYQRAVVEIRARMDDAEIDRLRRKGREMELDQVFEVAFGVIPMTGTAPDPARDPEVHRARS